MGQKETREAIKALVETSYAKSSADGGVRGRVLPACGGGCGGLEDG